MLGMWEQEAEVVFQVRNDYEHKSLAYDTLTGSPTHGRRKESTE